MIISKNQLKEIAIKTMQNGGVKSKQNKDIDIIVKGKLQIVKENLLNVLKLIK